MEVDQKHITTIRLHDAKGSDFQLVRDGRDYQLRIVSHENVVNITLGQKDLLRLCQQIIQVELPCDAKTPAASVPEARTYFVTGVPRHVRDTAPPSWYTHTETCYQEYE